MVLDLETNAGSFLQTDGTWTAQTTNRRNHSSMVKCWVYLQCLAQCDTVDGSNPAPVEYSIIPLYTRCCTSQVVVWDF